MLNRKQLLFASAVVLVACGRETGDPPVEIAERYSREDSAGVTIVRNFGPAWDSAGQWLISDAILRVGTVSGDQASMFSAIVDATRLSSGLIVVLDGIGELRAFSFDGRHLWTSGRLGQGPGEFRAPLALTRLDGDLIEVEDQAAKVIFDSAGSLIEHLTIDGSRIAQLGSVSSSDCRHVPKLLGNDFLLSPCRPESEPRSGYFPVEFMIGRIPSTLDRVDTVGTFLQEGSWGLEVAGGIQPIPVPLGEKGYLATGGNPVRLIYGTSYKYRLDVYELIGTPQKVMTIERTDGMRAPTSEEVQAAWTSWESVAEGFSRLRYGNYGPAIAKARQAISLPDSLSLVRGIVLDELNAIWVRTSTTTGGAAVWDVFAEDGIYLGEVSLPIRFTLHEVGADYLLGVERDALGVEYVVMFSLERQR